MPLFSITDLSFWSHFFLYILVVIFGYFIPGDLVLGRLSLPKVFRIPLAIVVGMVLFACQGFAFGMIHIRSMSWVYIITCLVVWILFRKKRTDTRFSLDTICLFLVIIGTIAQLTTVWFTGFTFHGSTTYCCGDPNDNLFYGTVSREIMHEIPPGHPGMVGEEFRNYHYWSNIVVGETARVFGLPVFQVQFQYSTVLMSLCIGLLLLAFSLELGATTVFSRWLLFFFYFGSDAIYWLIFVMRSAPWFSMSSLEDGVGFLANYPRAFAVMTGVAAMVLLFAVRKKESIWLSVMTALLFAITGVMKIYVGFFCYIGLLGLGLYERIFESKWTVAKIGVLTLLFFLPLYLSANADAGGIYFTGFWRAQNFVVQPWLNLLRFEQARIIYAADNKWVQVTIFNLGFTFLYFFAIFGSKLLAFLNTKKSLSQLPRAAHWFLIPPIVICAAIGFFFNQDTGGANSFNFLVCSFIFLSVYAALFMSNLTGSKKRWIPICLAVLVIIFTLPRSLNRIYTNISEIVSRKGFTISSGLFAASDVVRQKTDTDAIFLINSKSFPFDRSGPVFSMLMDRPMFLSGERLLELFNVPATEIQARQAVADTVFLDTNILNVAKTLKSNKIDYLLMKMDTDIASTVSASFFESWYGNTDIQVIKVHRELIPLSIYEEANESTDASPMRYKELSAPYLHAYGGK